MEQETIDELNEMRFRHYERMTSAMIESQQEMMRILTENTRELAKLVTRTDRLERGVGKLDERMTTVEELLTHALDDLAFIKEILKPGG